VFRPFCEVSSSLGGFSHNLLDPWSQGCLTRFHTLTCWCCTPCYWQRLAGWCRQSWIAACTNTECTSLSLCQHFLVSFSGADRVAQGLKRREALHWPRLLAVELCGDGIVRLQPGIVGIVDSCGMNATFAGLSVHQAQV
jgi:hypothetical protein